MMAKLLTSALFAGAVAGLIAGLLQLAFVQPVLLHAELYEGGELIHFGAQAVSAQQELPGFDPVRDLLSLLFSMLIYTGYALILLALMNIAWRPKCRGLRRRMCPCGRCGGFQRWPPRRWRCG